MIGGFQPLAFQPNFQQAAASTGAGRPKRRRRYVVEIDGQLFDVQSAEHARALLDRARELAVSQAEKVAATVVPQKAQRKTGTKPVALPTPRISSPDPELADVISQARTAINEIYRKAAIEAELAYLLARQMEEDEEEALLLLL